MFETPSGTIKPITYIGIVNNDKLLLVNYKQAPNPTKTGWWIPAPGIPFGKDPKGIAENTALEFGFTNADIKLLDVESFVAPGGWHMIYHYILKTNIEPKPHNNINAYKWVTMKELSQMEDIAHGRWEINVGTNFLKA
ncbi:MAG: hypothetical protein V4654_01815 [Bdellovibrionota bacterium]